MKKAILSLLGLLFITFGNAQSGDEEYYIMKCGTALGKKTEMIAACSGGIPENFEDAFTETEQMCDCLLSTISKYFTLEEFMAMVNDYGSDFGTVLIQNGEEEIVKEIQDCALSYVDDEFDLTKAEDQFEKGFMIGCISSIKNDPELKKLGLDENAYCECVKEEIMTRGFSLSQMEELKDVNSELFNEVVLVCIAKPGVLEGDESSNPDVEGELYKDEIPLINSGSSYKVKLVIGGVKKYFIIDSGASDIMISDDLEMELILEGIISTDNYLEEVDYELADGSVVACRRFVLNEVRIGEYTVNNVEIAVLDDHGDEFLLGKSFLDKFSSWSIDNQNETLILKK